MTSKLVIYYLMRVVSCLSLFIFAYKRIKNAEKIAEENYMLMHNDLARCPKCHEIKLREDMRYIGYVFSPNCFPVCGQCRGNYMRRRFVKHIVKEVDL